MVGSPLGLSATPPQTRIPYPRLGQHTAAVLTELLGYDDHTIADLQREGVV